VSHGKHEDKDQQNGFHNPPHRRKSCSTRERPAVDPLSYIPGRHHLSTLLLTGEENGKKIGRLNRIDPAKRAF
jgi:hypothetical protein